MSISKFLYQTVCVFSQIKENIFEQNFYSIAGVMPNGWDLGVLGVKNFSVGICDGAPLTAHSSLFFILALAKRPLFDINGICTVKHLNCFV